MVEAARKLVMFVTNVCPSKKGVQETVGAREEDTHVEGTALGTIKQREYKKRADTVEKKYVMLKKETYKQG
jgi:hypothetical protein